MTISRSTRSTRRYNEDPYGLSKFIGEVQADSICRGNGNLSVGSLRIHHLVASPD